MSTESQAVFFDAIRSHLVTPDPAALQAAARGHLGASRSLAELLAAYAEAMSYPEPHTPQQAAQAQVIADELAPVRMAARVAAGITVSTGAGGPH